MLFLGSERQRNCQGMSRRAFLQIGGSTALGLTLADLLALKANQGTNQTGPARSVIFLWLWGGPSQLDTWDPKPNAAMEFRGPFASISSRIPGVRIGELFPQIADWTDRLAIIRSLHTASNDHGVAGTAGLTGSTQGSVNLGGATATGNVRPCLGAIVARAKGFRSQMPPFMVVGGRLHQGKRAIAGEGGGTLGALYDPFRLVYEADHGTRVPALQLPANLSPDRLRNRQQLLNALDLARRSLDTGTQRTIDDYRDQAIALLTSPEATRMFDLSQERPELADRYGRTRFGQSCLLARRLVEHGVPFVQVNWSDHVEAEEDAGDGGWDNHYRNFQLMQDRQAPWLDQTLPALLSDLQDRGLLRSTLVVAIGEFGRTPRINDKAGRDHWEHCYSALVIGGGVRGGQVIGESDARAERPRIRPVTPADLGASVMHAVGITTEQAATLGINSGGQVIQELF
ncbi:MAG: DUF1501 domain-containing protein [Planctomycetes bacterium]|nr:DUF1501 domain-containing protein [Planctomycetota bacterium]